MHLHERQRLNDTAEGGYRLSIQEQNGATA